MNLPQLTIAALSGLMLLTGCSPTATPSVSNAISSTEPASVPPAESSAPASVSATASQQKKSSLPKKAQYTLIAATSMPSSHPHALGLEKMADLVDEYTDGAVTMQVFANAQLWDEQDLVEALQLGTIQAACVTTAPLANFSDDFLVFDLPFLFETEEEAHAVLESDFGIGLLDSMSEQGLKGLCYFENGFRHITSRSHPIVSAEDLEGLRIRTMDNPIQESTFSSLGAKTVPLPIGNVLSALQNQEIDAQENPLPVISILKMENVQSYLSLTGHCYIPSPLFVSQSFWDSLPEEYQNALQEAAQQASLYVQDENSRQTEQSLESLQEHGMEVITPDRSSFRQAVQPIYDAFIHNGPGAVSPDDYETVRSIIDALRNPADSADSPNEGDEI